MKVLIGAFNEEKALVGAFSMIVKLQTSQIFVFQLYCPLSTKPPVSPLSCYLGSQQLPPSIGKHIQINGNAALFYYSFQWRNIMLLAPSLPRKDNQQIMLAMFWTEYCCYLSKLNKFFTQF